MAYPTTLALIAALWSGPARTRSIALWSALGGAIAALGPLVSGFLLEHFEWGSVFIVTLPLAVVALVMAIRFVPAHVNETTEKVDNLGGILSAAMIGALILAINFAPVPGERAIALGLIIVAVVSGVAFVLRQQRVANPLYDLKIASRRVFWVAACAGIIVFGSLMGAMFIGQQYLQNVLAYTTLQAGAAIIPAALAMIIVAPRSAKLVEARGARFTLLLGYVFVLLGFVTMFVLWREGSAYWQVALGYAFVGIGVGFAGTPASHSLTGLGAGHPRRDGVGHGRSPARPRRGVHAVDLRGVADGGLRGRRVRGHGGRAERRPDHGQRPGAADQVVQQRRGGGRAVPAVRGGHHGRRQDLVPRRRRLGLRGRHHRGADRGGRRVLPVFPKRDDERRLLAEYHAAGHGRRSPRPDQARPVLFLRVYVPEALADEVASGLGAIDGVRHLARAPLVEPGAAMVTADVEPGSVDAALEALERFDIPADDVLLARLTLIGPARRDGPFARSADALIWSEVLGEARAQSRIVARYLAFMLIAGTIAAFGVLNGNSILIVGAMAVSPDLLPLTAACVGIVGRRIRLGVPRRRHAGGGPRSRQRSPRSRSSRCSGRSGFSGPRST